MPFEVKKFELVDHELYVGLKYMFKFKSSIIVLANILDDISANRYFLDGININSINFIISNKKPRI